MHLQRDRLTRYGMNTRDRAAHLLSCMPEDDARRYERFGHLQYVVGFVERIFVVYKMAKDSTDCPTLLSKLRVMTIKVDHRLGLTCLLRDEDGSSEMVVTHVPQRVFRYPLYISIAADTGLRWRARVVNGREQCDVSFGLLVKAKNKADFRSVGNVYMETPNNYRRLFPQAPDPLAISFAH
jgi:hypothetical protein